MTPLLSAFAPQAPLFVRMRGRSPLVVSASHAAGAVERLAAALPRARHSIQCCTDTLELALGTLAAWRAGQTVVMPSTRLAADVDRLKRRFDDSHVLDAAAFAAAVREAGATPGDDAAAALLAVAAPCWPAFTLPPAHPAVVLFTSGSTREPAAHAKSWDMLGRGALSFGQAFAPLSTPPLLAGTVDCHHMFGLEANLMASIRCGYTLCTDRPQWPADLRALLDGARARGDAPLWLVTTPLQLSAFLRARVVEPREIERVIVATMPLAQALAAEVEHDWHTRVDEIYGNTECGVMATRRTAQRNVFLPAPGVAFRFLENDAATVARLPDAAMPLDDRLAPCDGGGFELLGRRGDMVKVAGKRTTLRALDEQLLAQDGVVDGAFFVIDEDHGRVSAVAVAPAHTRATLRAALALHVDPAFMPRPLLLATSLPRDAQGKLARDVLLRMVESDGDADAGGRTRRIERQHAFPSSHPAFAGHFPGHPIMPGAALLAEVEGALVAGGYRVLRCDNAKFLWPVAPDECFTLRADCSDPRRVPFEIIIGGRVGVRGVFCCEPAIAEPVA